jgi:hypothetical protein
LQRNSAGLLRDFNADERLSTPKPDVRYAAAVHEESILSQGKYRTRMFIVGQYDMFTVAKIVAVVVTKVARETVPQIKAGVA